MSTAVLNRCWLSHLNWVTDGTLAPLDPAAVVDGNPRPTHQVGIEPSLACAPAGAAVKGDPLVARDPGIVPVGRDLRVGSHRVVDVAVVLHVIGIRAAVPPDVAPESAGRGNVVVAAHRADVLPPGPPPDERGMLLIGQDLPWLIDVDDDLGACRDLGAKRRDRLGLVEDRF